jgi:hypothetical protein
MTMMQRAADTASASIAFTATEQALLDRLVHHVPTKGQSAGSLAYYLLKLACLGGYLPRSRDPPPGNIVMWRGLARLTDIELGFMVAIEVMGN